MKNKKKFMSHHIPSNYIINSENIQRDKLRSIFVQLNLRKRFILLKYFFNWKLLSYLNKNNNEKIELKNNDNNGNQLKLINIDNNEDVDIKELNSNNVDEQNSNNNHSIIIFHFIIHFILYNILLLLVFKLKKIK